jgi:hypothetical protein
LEVVVEVDARPIVGSVGSVAVVVFIISVILVSVIVVVPIVLCGLVFPHSDDWKEKID